MGRQNPQKPLFRSVRSGGAADHKKAKYKKISEF
jgi:hypothetical protein